MAYLKHDEHVGRALDLYGEWAEGELELLSLFVKPGAVVVDVGANIGTHAVALAQKAGPSGAVFAFEPQRVVHQVLCANFALNGLLSARALHAAVGATPGGLRVPDIDYAVTGNFGGVPLGGWAEGETVPVLTLDGFDLARCDLLKIDVEGMELDVMRGAERTLARLSPVLYFENNGPHGAPEAVKFLQTLGYSLHWHFSPFFRANNFAHSSNNVFGALVDANVLAVPPALHSAVGALAKVQGPDDTAAEALRRGLKTV